MGGRLGPRLVVAGAHSGVGKTTVATGLMAALRGAGARPAGAKVGPDFIDPGYHSLACGRPPRNLDAWICGPAAVAPLARRAGSGSDVLVVEGVMGLFDRASDGSPSSTADVATLLDAPVLLVVDAATMAGSVSALVHGFATFDPTVRVAGVVLNRVASAGHEMMLRAALTATGVPVVGVLRRDPALAAWRDRQLGLLPVAEEPGAVRSALDRLAVAVGAAVDLDAVRRMARSAPVKSVPDPPLPPSGDRRVRVGVAAVRTFAFAYTDTLEALVAAGAEVVTFDPCRDQALPDDVDGLFVGGAVPEAYGPRLAANRPMLDDVRHRIEAGLPAWVEGGGLPWLCRSLDGSPMAGVVPAVCRTTDRLNLGYRTATLTRSSAVGDAGARIRGHEYHHSESDPPGDALAVAGRGGHRPQGWASPTMLASYVSHHPGGDPSPVARFVSACSRRAAALA